MERREAEQRDVGWREAERRNVERHEAEQRDAERREAEQRDVELREQERRRMERRETVLQDVDHRISQRHSERLEMDYCEANQRTCHMFSSRNQQPYQTMTENRRTVPRQGERLDVHEANESTMHGCDEPGYSEQLQRVLQRQQESLITMAQTLGTSISRGFEMPKRDYMTFDGNPMNYPRFMENFRVSMQEREQNYQAKLAYLIQFCTGIAKEAISSCVILPGNEGFRRAKEILYNSFGQSHIIIHAYINKVIKGGSIKDGESGKLLELARDMENCQINLTQLGCESEINTQSNLEKIVTRLPRYLQADWAKEAYVLLESNKTPTFQHLTNYIKKKAKLANSAYGQLIGSRPPGAGCSKAD